MPRARDIGWQHGKMIGEHRHHLQCNYCHRTMIGGVTRFKKHLASTRGEIRGCEAVPKEVRELISKHLAAGKMRKTAEKKQKKVDPEVLKEQSSEDKVTESDESDPEAAASRLETLRTLQEAEEACQPKSNDHQQPMVETREFFDALSIVHYKNEQGLAPPRATDPGWAHGMMVDGDRQKIKCRYCHKVILGGGISRLKQHLAGERGNIAPCENVPEDVRAQMQHHLGFKVSERLKKQKEPETIDNSLISSLPGRGGGNSDDLQMSRKAVRTQTNNGKRKGNEGTSGRRKRHRKQLISIATPITQRPLDLTFASQESIDQADMAVAKFIYDAGVPLNATNSLYFQLMADAIAAVGPGYKMPSYRSLRGDLLNKSVQEAGELCQELRKSWEVTGCSVMVDRWKDRTGRKLLMDRYKTFFWSACVAHCIDLMLEELGKMDMVKEVVVKAKRISQFIYNKSWVHNLMKKTTGGRDIVRHAITRFANNFLTLQSIISLKEPLHQMFTSMTWMQSAFSKERAGIEVTEIVVDPLFWSLCAEILMVAKPLLAVLQLVDGEERSSMGYIYDAMEKAKKGIIVALSNKESDYLSYLKVVDKIWDEEFHSPLHAAGYYLNPCTFYNPSFSNKKVIQKGLLDCIETLEPNSTAQDMITKHINFYEDAVGGFSRPVALRTRESLAPATWWSLYAAEYPDLQRFAIRILSQTCSGAHSVRNWSMFDRIHLQKRNRLEGKRLNDLMFVHYNLRMRARQSAASKTILRGNHDPTCLEAMDVDAGDWIEDPASTLEREDLGSTSNVDRDSSNVTHIQFDGNNDF
ncbi:zinc finger protein [Macleaya cordata]|uniref:Zinc finger protein n=1 Tax=Macleaya cordata TaxID=56857 RepID=A0A200Q9Q7_MACCD|nr:zinc finger protein [Macleaya cordata]